MAPAAALELTGKITEHRRFHKVRSEKGEWVVRSSSDYAAGSRTMLLKEGEESEIDPDTNIGSIRTVPKPRKGDSAVTVFEGADYTGGTQYLSGLMLDHHKHLRDGEQSKTTERHQFDKVRASKRDWLVYSSPNYAVGSETMLVKQGEEHHIDPDMKVGSIRAVHKPKKGESGVTVFEGADYTGDTQLMRSGVRRLSEYFPKGHAGSLIVHGKDRWLAYTGEDYTGLHRVIEAGEYANSSELIKNHRVKSIKKAEAPEAEMAARK